MATILKCTFCKSSLFLIVACFEVSDLIRHWVLYAVVYRVRWETSFLSLLTLNLNLNQCSILSLCLQTVQSFRFWQQLITTWMLNVYIEIYKNYVSSNISFLNSLKQFNLFEMFSVFSEYIWFSVYIWYFRPADLLAVDLMFLILFCISFFCSHALYFSSSSDDEFEMCE